MGKKGEGGKMPAKQFRNLETHEKNLNSSKIKVK
jgi:hypothetical protein